jgi:hypothetical protein
MTLSGEYLPIVTVHATAGFFSSSGGWNSSDPNRLQIAVQSTPTQTTFASVTDPVDLKWQTPCGANVADTKTDTKRIKADRIGLSSFCLNSQQNRAYLRRNGGKIRPIPTLASIANATGTV